MKHSGNLSVDEKLNAELKLILDWLQANKLSLNAKKSKYMIFHTPQKKIDPLQLKFDNILLERVSEFNFLGLTVTETLLGKTILIK